MNILAVIPARYQSQRFPGKPLVMLDERPMVQWVYEAAKSCDFFQDAVVATDNDKIADCVKLRCTHKSDLGCKESVQSILNEMENPILIHEELIDGTTFGDLRLLKRGLLYSMPQSGGN